MSTYLAEIKASQMTRIAGQTELVALDVDDNCGKNRARVESVERFDAIVGTNISVTSSATALKVGGSNATNRRALLVQNLGTLAIYVGPSSVTTANGIKVNVEESMSFPVSETATLYAIAASGTHDVRIIEVSA